MALMPIFLIVLWIATFGLMDYLPTYLYPPYPLTMSEPSELWEMRRLVSIGVLFVMVSISVVCWFLNRKSFIAKMSVCMGSFFLVTYVIFYFMMFGFPHFLET